MCASQIYLCDHTLGTETHVSANNGVLFENKAESAKMLLKIRVYINFNVNGFINGKTVTRAIQKVISCELLIKQAMRKNYYMQEVCTYFSYFST
jgi:hypothetical protein